MTAPLLRKAEPQDAVALSALCRATFIAEFGHLYTERNLNTFLDSSYTCAVQAAEIADAELHVTVVEQHGRLVGYALSGPCVLPVADMPPCAYQLRRIYLLPESTGQGLGMALLGDALAFFREKHASAVYVGVWSENFRAQAFYRKAGFEKVGEHIFMIGEHADEDWILRLKDWPLI